MRPCVVVVRASRATLGCRLAGSFGRNELRAVRSLSSRVPPTTSPTVITGWDARCGWLERVLCRSPRFIEYTKQRVFAPSLSPGHHALMFVALQAPQRLDLDVHEFLKGARAATKQVLKDAHIDEFVQMTLQSRHSVRSYTPSPLIHRMRSYCLPASFQQIQATVHRSFAQAARMRMLDVHVESAHLTRVQYACLTENEYHNEQNTQLLLLDDDNVDTLGNQTLVERLQLQVELRTVEELQESQPTDAMAPKKTILQQRNVYVARFTSLVTDPDQLDWRLSSLAMRTRGKPEVATTRGDPRPLVY